MPIHYHGLVDQTSDHVMYRTHECLAEVRDKHKHRCESIDRTSEHPEGEPCCFFKGNDAHYNKKLITSGRHEGG